MSAGGKPERGRTRFLTDCARKLTGKKLVNYEKKTHLQSHNNGAHVRYSDDDDNLSP